jgi:YD repeat-containing protein
VVTVTKNDELASANKIVTNYLYDSEYGNMISESVTFPDKHYNTGTKILDDISKTITTAYTYTDDGRFLKTKKDFLGPDEFITEYSYDDLGNVLSVKTPEGFTKLYEYINPFKSLSRTINHDGTWTAVTVGWDGTDKPTNGLYYSSVTSNIYAPATKYYDKVGRELRTVGVDFMNRKVFADKSINSKGQLEWQTLPYFSGTPVKKHFTYDEFGLTETEYFDYNEQKITYDYDYQASRKVKTIYDGTGRYDEKTTNAWGAPDLVTDGYGNTITYQYTSIGKPSAINAAGVITKMNYDVYGKQVYVKNGSAKRNYQFGENLVNGVYVVEIRQGNNRKTIKLVKQ